MKLIETIKNKMNYSPQVVNTIANASGLATQLRQIMQTMEKYKQSNQMVPVMLKKKAELLLDQVDDWENQNVCVEETYHMRFTPQTQNTSPSVSQNNSPTLKKKSNPLLNKSFRNLNTKIKNKYKNEWDNLQKRQQRLFSST